MRALGCLPSVGEVGRKIAFRFSPPTVEIRGLLVACKFFVGDFPTRVSD
jgi:hypothetical protein